MTTSSTGSPDCRQRLHPRLFDGLLVAGLVVLGIASMYLYVDLDEQHLAGDPFGALVVVVTTGPLLFRRRFPVAANALVAVAMLIYTGWDYASLAATPAMLIAVYSAGAYAPLVAGLSVVVAHVVVTAAYVASAFGQLTGTGFVSLNLFFAAFGYVGVWSIGRAIRKHRRYTEQLEDRTARLEHAREAEVRAALAEERSRIARELHDVVAHHVSVMTVQAAGAQRSLERDPVRAGVALGSIETMGHAALAEMRRIVDVLRGPERDGRLGDAASHRGPQPGVADLDLLLDHMSSAGVAVELTVDGDLGMLPAGVDVTVFRIVQEALTNTLKHAGPSEVGVHLGGDVDSVSVRIRDNGRGLAAELDGHPAGHGLLGLRERVTLYGGTLAAGPRHGGGFEVRAHIPVERSELSAVHR